MARTTDCPSEFYIRLDTYWRHSPDRFVGPFPNRQEAQTEIDRALDAPGSLVLMSTQNAANVRDGIRVFGVMSKSVARRQYRLKDWRLGDEASNVLGKRIPLSTQDLFSMEEAQYA